MDFLDAIESLQQKPLHKRKRLLVLGVLVSMLTIIGIWLSLPNTISSGKTAQEKNTNTTQTAGPFDMLKNEIKKMIQGLPSPEASAPSADITGEPNENPLVEVPLESSEVIMEPVE